MLARCARRLVVGLPARSAALACGRTAQRRHFCSPCSYIFKDEADFHSAADSELDHLVDVLEELDDLDLPFGAGDAVDDLDINMSVRCQK